MKYFYLLAILAFAISGNAQNDFVKNAEKAHSKSAYLEHDAVQFDIISSFGTREWINATITLSTDSGNGKIVFKNGSTIITNGMNVYYSKDLENPKGVRFTAYTVPYFFMFPYKLSDNGTIWSEYSPSEKSAGDFDVQRLTFKSGVGDAPDDWYTVYTSRKTHLIDHAGYIVTSGKSVEKAEEQPHAIRYMDYQMVEGIPFSTQWQFYGWNKSEGLTEQIGKAAISNIKFIKTTAGTFKPDLSLIKG